VRVLFLTNLPSPYRVDFFNELGKQCELTVLFDRNKADDREESWLSNKSTNFNGIFLKGIKLGNKPPLCTEVISYLKKFEDDIIIIGQYSSPTGMLAIEYLKFKNIPFILNIDGGLLKKENNIKFKIKKHFISAASSWLSTGKESDNYLLKYGADWKKIYHYPFSSIRKDEIMNEPLTKRKKESLKKKLGINYEYLVLGVGRFIPLKNYELLLNNWEKVDSNVMLCLIGGGPEEERYKKIISNKRLKNVKILSFKEKEELNNYYLSADIFIHPTSSDVWGLVINEALAFGLPIITTDDCIAGVELIENNINGFVTPSSRFDLMLANLNLLINDEELRKKIHQNNLLEANNYTIEKMAKRHIEIFKNINPQ